MPYLLFLKKQQNLKLSSAAKCRWVQQNVIEWTAHINIGTCNNIHIQAFGYINELHVPTLCDSAVNAAMCVVDVN